MAVKIGHSSINENGKVSGGKPGDQTGKEVCTRTYYKHPWHTVIRAKNKTTAEKIATAMEQACANDKIGYCQAHRTSLYDEAKKNNWDLSKIKVACEGDCSSTVSVCVNAAGISVSKNMYTGNEKECLRQTGKFDILTDSKYTNSDTYLERGDILLGNGHTAIVLTNGSGVIIFKPTKKKEEKTKSSTVLYYKKYTGNSVSIVDALMAIGVKATFVNREKIAKANGITKYSGSHTQNTKLLSLLKQGKLKKA